MGKMTADVIIIGGGVNGCAAAYYLAKKGVRDVIVLEADKSIGPVSYTHLDVYKRQIVVGMIYMFLPFAVLPMYSSIEKLDPGLVEASKDLGAGPVKTFFKVTLPLTSPGVFAAVILTFIPCIGYYMVTDMLGGCLLYTSRCV